MSQNLKKELTEALNALQEKPEPSEDIKIMRKIGAKNRMMELRFKVTGWCFEGDHPIIDLEGGE